jgi:plastocyanin
MKKILVVLSLCAAGASSLSAGTVAGTVSFVTKRGQHPIPAETVVWLEPAKSSRPPRLEPVRVRMATRSKMLFPHVVAVPIGSTVEFPNDDPIFHNLFSLSSPNNFDLGLYRRGAGKSHTFNTPGIVNVYCNVHPGMSSVIHVMSTPYFGFATAEGKYSLEGIQPGEYNLMGWNEQGGVVDTPVQVNAQGQVTGNLNLSFDSRSYRESRHLNKDGQPYEAPRSRDY